MATAAKYISSETILYTLILSVVVTVVKHNNIYFFFSELILIMLQMKQHSCLISGKPRNVTYLGDYLPPQ